MIQKNSSASSSGVSSIRDRLLQRFFPSRQHRQQYAEYLGYQHRSFDVKGLTTQGVYTLELAQVFVDLGLGPLDVDQASADPIRAMPNTLRRGRHDVWAYLRAEQERGETIVVLGPPGSGKTTLLKHLALSLADATPDESVTHGYNHLPILLFLRDHAEAIKTDRDYSIETAVATALEKWPIDLPANWFQEQLAAGTALIMLDGLDEVGDADTRRQVVGWTEQQIRRYGRNQFVVTSRPFGYRSNPLQRAVVLEVQPFTIEQVEQFVHNWYLANEIMSAQRDDPGVRMEAKQGADDLLWRLRRAHVLLDMAVNPLLLTMIATVHRYRSSLPGRRVELYAEISEVFLGKRQQARGMHFDLTPAQKQRVLQPLAYHMMLQSRREIPLETAVSVIQEPLQRVSPQTEGAIFLKMIVDSSGLLVEREAGRYSFAHHTFQEYLAAAHVQDQRLEAELIARVDDTWWHETIRLYAARVDASNIIRACLGRRTPSVQALTLAMECLEEAREVHAELRNIFERLAGSVDHPNHEVRRISSEVRLALRTRRMLRVDEDRYVDNAFVTHAEYQLFLDAARSEDRYHQPDHWAAYSFAQQQGQTPAAGIRPLDAVAFCEWLTQKNKDEWQYRLPRSNELPLIAANGQTQEAKRPLSYWFSGAGGVECVPVSLPSGGGVIAALNHHIESRFGDDWRRHKKLTHQQQALELLLQRARQRTFTLIDLDRNLNVSRLQSPDIMRDFSVACDRGLRTRAQVLADALDYALALLHNPNPGYMRRLDMEAEKELAARLAADTAHAQHLGAAPQQARALLRQVEAAYAHAQPRDLVLSQELLRSLMAALQEAKNLIVSLRQAYEQARRRVRATAVWHINDLLAQLDAQSGTNFLQSRRQTQHLLQAYVDLYLDFAILEARIEGQMPALEGIRVVKERKPPVAVVD